MKYEVKNISNATYAGAVRIKRNETVIVTKEVFDYLEKTFGKFNMFEFTKTGSVSKETKVEAPKETKVESPKETKVEAPKETKQSRKRKK